MEYTIARYLLSITRSGAEKAETHLRLARIYVASRKMCLEDKANRHFSLVMRIHDATQYLTGYLDTEIGFAKDGSTYASDRIIRKFFERFIELADEEWKAIESEGIEEG